MGKSKDRKKEKTKKQAEDVKSKEVGIEDGGQKRILSRDAQGAANSGADMGVGDEYPEKEELPVEIPVLPQPDNVIFPGMALPAHVTDEDQIQLLEKIVMGDKFFLAVAAKNSGEDLQDPENLYEMGTTCAVVQMVRMPDGSVRFLAQGLQRSKVKEYVKTDSYLQASVEHLSEEVVEDEETAALVRILKTQFMQMLDAVPNAREELESFINSVKSPGRMADLMCSNLGVSVSKKQEVLETLNVKKRLERVGEMVASELEYLQVARRIQSRARDEIDKGQREYYLRQQLKAIQDELGETDAQTAEVNELRHELEQKELPEEAKEAAEHELGRLEAINPASPEYNVVRTYLDWILKLPWCESTEDKLDLDRAEEVLEEDHYGLEKIKERILEFLAVRKLRKDMKGSILCFQGPPGTGKTSIGRSIARAMGRKYVRVSLGGVRDEAEIRGHRRTYIGALPGQIILGLKKVGSNNPVFMLDEVDKLSSDFRGDPASALLEALDPEQNENFTDHYLDLHFDLSRVMFICTANVADTIPHALRDRMEILEFPGYTEEEKLQIARQYLVPKQVEAHGLTEGQISFSDNSLKRMISEYTREAGVRNLERNVASVCRKVASNIARGRKQGEKIDKRKIEKLLGPPKYIPEIAERVDEPGVATGLAWTATGGTVMFVEVSRTPGEGKLTLTGQLGDVMKESAKAALTYARAHADEFGVSADFFRESDFHIHVPAGAIPKDGPSAGVTIGVALISLCTRRLVRHNVGMTGEITLRGKVLPVGGIKEKAIAGKRAGLDTIVLPKQNEKDLPDVPEHAKRALKFVFVDTVDEMLPVVLRDEER
jgi:ATP-dependent Lon protease